MILCASTILFTMQRQIGFKTCYACLPHFTFYNILERTIFAYLLLSLHNWLVLVYVCLFQLSFISHTRQNDMIVPWLLNGKRVHSKLQAFQLWFEHLHTVAFRVEYLLLTMHSMFMTQSRKTVYWRRNHEQKWRCLWAVPYLPIQDSLP